MGSYIGATRIYTDSAPWRSSAKALARFTMESLVVRHDVWGEYLPTWRRVQHTRADGTRCVQKTITAPSRDLRGKVFLTERRIARHYAGRDGAIIGLHTTSEGNFCLRGAFEVDLHVGDSADANTNKSAMLYWLDRLLDMGIYPILSDSNGDGGFHLNILFDRPVPAPKVFTFLKQIVSDHAKLGLAAAPETFPKQPVLGPGKYGNWLRLWGRHHTKDHWTRVFDLTTGEWAEGDKAITLLLGARKNDPALIPPPPPDVRPIVRNTPPRSSWTGNPADDRAIAVRCLDTIGGADDYATWIRVGQALHAVDPGPTLFVAWEHWSRQSGKFVEGECWRKWQTFSGGHTHRVALGTLIHLARQGGGRISRWGTKA